MKAIDVSIYSGEISVDQWRKVKADGYDLAIVGLFHGRSVNPYAAQQMRTAHEAGMLLAGYVLLAPWMGWTGTEQVQLGMAQIDSRLRAPIEFIAVDCEIDGITEGMILEALMSVEDHNLRPIIYTGWWWWYGHFNDSRAFPYIPLWAADYDGEANLDTRMYGGWTKAVGKQYAGTTMLHGVNCDLNFFDDAFVKEEEVPGFTEEQEERIKEIVNWCGPGLEMQARMGVLGMLKRVESFVVEGRWNELPRSLLAIEGEARRWHRWPDD